MVIVEQPFIHGKMMADTEIAIFVEQMGFKSINPRNWTFANKDIYLSDMHDENVLRTPDGHICVIDCDIRINIPELRRDSYFNQRSRNSIGIIIEDSNDLIVRIKYKNSNSLVILIS